MTSSDQVRENFIRIIESQELLNGRYKEIQRLNAEAGNGYFSLFFRARDTQTDLPVALKFFNPTRASDSYRLRCFERESRILTLLNGKPNMLELVEPQNNFRYESRDQATGLSLPYDFQYLAVKLARCSLNDYIHSDNWDPLESLVLFREACKGVQRLHAMSICHRDLKPDNLLLFSTNDLRLSDFGTAKILGGQEPSLLQFYPAPVGDVRYTSLELLALLDFEDSNVYASDIFALGAMLFELFTGIVLTLELYTFETIRKLITYFTVVPKSSRREIFDGSVEEISNQVLSLFHSIIFKRDLRRL